MPHVPRRRRHPAKPGRPTTRHVVTDRCGPTGKVRYRSEGQAAVAIDELARKQDPKHPERRAYKCPMCAGWHLTKQAA